MSIPRILLGAALVAAFSMPLVAQQKPTGYYEDACVNVKPGQNAAFHAFSIGPGHKVEQQLVNSGRIQTGLMMRTVLPVGTDAGRCDYLFVDFYKGLPPAPMTMEETSQALHDAGLAMTAKDLDAQEMEVSTLVNEELARSVMQLGEAKKGDYIVVNEMDAPHIGACLSLEKKDWQPMAEAMMKAGDISGWVANVQIFPWGAKDGYRVSTVDIYPSWDAFVRQDKSIDNAWKVVHPGTDMNGTLAQSTFTQFDKLCPIKHTTLFKVEDVVTPKQ